MKNYGFLMVRFKINAIIEMPSNTINGAMYPPLDSQMDEQPVAINAPSTKLNPERLRLAE